MGRHTDMEMTVRKEEFCYTHRSLKIGGTLPRATWESTRDGQEAVREKEDMDRALTVESMGKNQGGSINRFRIGCFEYFHSVTFITL